MNYTVIYSPSVLREDLPSLSKPMKARIKSAIESKLMTGPEAYGLPLGHSLKNNWKLRIGDYRVVYRIEKGKVMIWTIGHRSIVYAIALKRLIAGLE